VLYDAKRHTHTAQGLSLSTVHGDLLWCGGGWPGSCHEQELVRLAGLEEALDATAVVSLLDRGFRGMAKDREHWHVPIGDRRTKDTLNEEIAGQLFVSPATAKTHVSRATVKLGARDRAQLVVFAYEAGLTRGRCAAGGGCCIASATSTAPPPRWCASAAGSTGSPPDEHHGHPQCRRQGRLHPH